MVLVVIVGHCLRVQILLLKGKDFPAAVVTSSTIYAFTHIAYRLPLTFGFTTGDAAIRIEQIFNVLFD